MGPWACCSARPFCIACTQRSGVDASSIAARCVLCAAQRGGRSFRQGMGEESFTVKRSAPSISQRLEALDPSVMKRE